MRAATGITMLLSWLAASPAFAVSLGYTEEFASDAANWYDAGSTGPLGWVAAGGPDGGSYASGLLDFGPFIGGDTLTAVRAQDELGSSGGAFEGDYITEGVLSLSVFVRHDAPVPLNAFARFASPANFPGAIAIAFAPLAPDTWTELVFDLTPSSPQLVSFEGSSYGAVFSNVGHVQIGIEVPDALAGSAVDYHFDVDGVSIVPEPTTATLWVCALAAWGVLGRRRP